MPEKLSVADEIQKLKKLLDDGVITQKEFDSQKEILLKGDKPHSPPQELYGSGTGKPNKKSKKGCFVGFIIGLALLSLIIFGISQAAKNAKKGKTDETTDTTENISTSTTNTLSSSEPTTELSTDLKKFDLDTWEQFKKLYDAHHNLMIAMADYSDGLLSKLDFYNYCQTMEKYFMEFSTYFNYGTTDYEKSYLSVFSSWAISDQLATKKLIKYLDSSSISDLSDAQKEIQSAKTAAVMIASNRAILLKDAGYSSDEIDEIINKITEELDGITK